MHSIQNTCIGTAMPFNKAIAGFTCVLAITVIVLSIIGLRAAPSGPFNTIVQLGMTTNGILLVTSIFVFILDLVWISALCKKTKEQSVSQPESLEQEFSQSVLVPAIEEINDTDSFSQLPEEIILRTFGFLNAIELAKSDEVSRRWRRLASDPTLWDALDLRTFSPLLKVFDESDWVKHVDLSSFGLDVTDVPPLDKHQAIPVLKRYLSSLPIEGNAGITLLTIPKGLTFNKLVKLAGSPKLGKATNFRYICNRISEELGDIPVDETYRIVITNNVFKKSRNLSISDQKALVSKTDCELPKALEAVTLIVATFMGSEEILFLDKTTMYSEQVDDYRFVIEKIPDDGIYVFSSILHGVHEGVGGVFRKL